MEWLKHWIDGLTPINVSLLVILGMACYVAYQWNKSKDHSFQLDQMLVDSVTGKISIEKVGYVTALTIGSWGFIALIQTGKMTESYFMGYLGVFALSRAASSAISVTKDVKMDPNIKSGA